MKKKLIDMNKNYKYCACCLMFTIDNYQLYLTLKKYTSNHG